MNSTLDGFFGAGMNILERLTWQDWAAACGVVFGIVTLLAFLDQRRSAKKMEILATWAGLNLDKTMSEKEIRGLLSQKADMEDQVRHKIPALARRAVLHEQRKLHEKAVAEHFTAWQLTSHELGLKDAASSISPELQKVIVEDIVPPFLRHERRDRFRTRVTVLSVILAVFATLLPSPLGGIFALLMSVPLIYAAARLYALNEGVERACKIIGRWCHLGYATVSLTFIVSGCLLGFYENGAATKVYLRNSALIVGTFLALAYFFVRKWLDQFVAHLCSTPKVVG